MSTSSSERDPVEELAEEFLNRCRRGERPALSEYTNRYPEWAERIRSLFPLLVDMEAARPDLKENPSAEGVGADPKLDRLGDYQVLQEVGRGGMGIVYEAVQVSLGRHVALKLLPRHALLDPRHLQRFKREAKAAARLHHSNIVPVYGVGEEDGLHYYVMQFIQGLSLEEVLAELRRLRRRSERSGNNGQSKDPQTKATREVSAAAVAQLLLSRRFSAGPASGGRQPPAEARGGRFDQGADAPRLPGSDISIHMPGQSADSRLSDMGKAYWQSVADVGVQVAAALAYASSQGILHRDIKPSNLLLDTQGTVWVTDFGLAKAADGEDLTLTGDVVGTLRYLAPERLQGKSDPRGDVYSLGITLYELLTLRPAFVGTDRARLMQRVAHEDPLRPRKLDRRIPHDLETIVLKAMDKEPARRYRTAAELAEDLRRFLADRPVQARPIGVLQRIVKWARRRPAAAALVGVSFMAFLSLLVGTSWHNAQLRQANQAETRAKGELEHALERERQNSYYQRIGLADREWFENNLDRMEQFLEACPADLRGWEWRYLKRLRYKTHSSLHHDSMILCVAFSPVGSHLASCSQDGVIKVWDAHSDQLVQWFDARPNVLRCLAFSPDGQRLAVACSDNTVRIWDMKGDNKPLEWKAHRSQVTWVAFSPDGRRLASSCFGFGWEGDSAGGEAKVWDAATAQEICTFKGQPLGIHSVVFSPDGRRLASGSEDHTVKVWDARTGGELFTCSGHTEPVVALAFSPDGQSLASGSTHWGLPRGEVRFWDARTGELERTFRGHIGCVLSLAFSPDGRRLASGGMDRTVKLWDVASGRDILTLRGHRHTIRSVAFSADGRLLASASADREVRIWDATSLKELPGEEPPTLHVHPAGVLGVAFHPDGQRLASVADNGGVRLWDWHTTKPLFALPDSEGFWCLAISPDGQRLAAGGEGIINVWDLRAGHLLAPLRGFSNKTSSVAFGPDSWHLVSAHWDKRVRVWDTATKEVRPIPAHGWAIDCLALSPDGKFAVTASVDETVKVWEIASSMEITRLEPRHTVRPWCVAFRPDGQVLASGSLDGTIKLWETQTWKQCQELRDPRGAGVVCMAFSPDNRLLAWGSTDATVKVWDVRSEETRSLRGHTSWVKGVAFSPDGKWIASASLDGTIKLWQLARWWSELPVRRWLDALFLLCR
jgi:WD40 repeat protein/serine/threonine protein kinase